VRVAAPESLVLLLFPPRQRGIPVHDLGDRAAVEPRTAEASPLVYFSVEQANLGERLPGELAGTERPLGFILRRLHLISIDVAFHQPFWTLSKLSLEVGNLALKPRHHCPVLSLREFQE
jgi:hypothetical protein